jgi:N6-L-threonylcarbamoyladenine synthase
MAAIYSSGAKIADDECFCAFHVSGGTTECLKVKRGNGEFISELVGGTRDLNSGQVIDRVGVKLGLKFPAGAELEKMAANYNGKLSYKRPSTEGTYVNLSGLENMADRMYKESGDKCMTAAFVLNYIADALLGITDAFVEKYGMMPFVFAGGVMCNSIIKKKISEKYTAYFAAPSLSSDNAVGIAVLTREAFLR